MKFAIALAIFISLALFASADPWINGQVYTGQATYYTLWQNNLGSCGLTEYLTNDNLVALSFKFMGNPPGGNPNNDPLCAPQYCIMATGPQGTTVAKVMDTCADCPDYNIDLSPSHFSQIADLAQGRVPVTWQFVNCYDYYKN